MVASDRLPQARIKTYAIFVKQNAINTKTGGRTERFVRRPYNIVEYDWNNGEPVRTYLQPAGPRRTLGQSAGAVTVDFGSIYNIEVYDDVRFYDTPPSFDSIYGQSQK